MLLETNIYAPCVQRTAFCRTKDAVWQKADELGWRRTIEARIWDNLYQGHMDVELAQRTTEATSQIPPRAKPLWADLI